ncbi:MFS transporter [Lacticaseibacillus daqingensis]|uniref:MFS transporter n=1 Tax=Lacticaseibacillus daqingensis TaxID=2486014 RepID=UPI000F76EA59|nr:MFS transporter [Lacticaseibacillus daqingensis]
MTKRNITIVTLALLLSNAMSGLDGTIVNTALPAIIADLHGLRWMAWLVAVFLLGTAVSTLIWSKLGERVGNKTAYQLAAVFFVVGSLLQGIAPNMGFLILARGLAGIGNGGMISLPYIIYAELYPQPRRRMQVLGFVSASYSTATIIGPLVGGAIVDTLSWHWVFYLNVPIGLLSAVLIQVFYQTQARPRAVGKTDALGAGLMAVGLIALLCAIEFVGLAASWVVAVAAVIAVLAFAGLVRVERTAADPIIPGRLFQNRALVIDFALFTLIWGAFIGFLTYSPMWAQGLIGTTALIGGATQIPGSVTDFIGSEAVPGLRRFCSPHQVVMIGIAMLIISFVLMVGAGVQAPYWLLLVAAGFEGFGNGGCFNELQVKVQQDAALQDVPVATSFSFLLRMLSQTFTTAIFGLLVNRALLRGIAATHGRVTLAMMNKLSDSHSAGSLPQALMPQMRQILHSGLHNVMVLALVLMLIAAAINGWAQHLERVAA